MHDRALDAECSGIEVDLSPPQTAELAAAHAGRNQDPQGDGDIGRLRALGGVDEAPDIGGFGRADAASPQRRGCGGVGGVGRQPLPAHGLAQGGVQHPVVAVDRARAAPAGQQMTVEAVEVGGGELAHITRPDQRHELADYRAGKNAVSIDGLPALS